MILDHSMIRRYHGCLRKHRCHSKPEAEQRAEEASLLAGELITAYKCDYCTWFKRLWVVKHHCQATNYTLNEIAAYLKSKRQINYFYEFGVIRQVSRHVLMFRVAQSMSQSFSTSLSCSDTAVYGWLTIKCLSI